MRPFSKDDPGQLKNSQQSQFKLRLNLETVSMVFIKFYICFSTTEFKEEQILISLHSRSTQTKFLCLWILDGINMNLGQFSPHCAFSSKMIF